MKLLRLKITDPAGFRSLPFGFEYYFRTKWNLQDEKARPDDFAPFVCAGRNGSGKSNLLELLSAIFFQLEISRVRRSFLPEVLQNADLNMSPSAYELDYLIKLPKEYRQKESSIWAHVEVRKVANKNVSVIWVNQSEFSTDLGKTVPGSQSHFLLPEYVLGYSSGENEILSLPFFKLRFVQFDEYWNALSKQLTYPGQPETRLTYLDSGFSQAIFLCNLLFQNEETLKPFKEDIGINELQEFRIILRRSIPLRLEQLEAFASEDQSQRASIEEIVNGNPALSSEEDTQGVVQYRLNLLHLLEGDEKSSLAVSALKRCATLSHEDEANDSLILDFWVNDKTKTAFKENFDGSALTLFQAFQVLLTLNLYSVNDVLKTDIYSSNSHYVGETVPVLASDQRITRFKFVKFSKQGAENSMMLKQLSDGEHQLLHSLGLCLLFRDSNCVFLLDEPETHFNPNWRANFISRLRQCFPKNGDYNHEMLITTHTPFLISDSKPENVLVFNKDTTSGDVVIERPDYNTLGASINKITMNTFDKSETIGGYAQEILDNLRERYKNGEEQAETLIAEINRELGDSVEKILLINEILSKEVIRKSEEKD